MADIPKSSTQMSSFPGGAAHSRRLPPSVRSAEVHEGLLFSADPLKDSRSTAQTGPLPDTSAVKSGSEAGMSKFCEQTFVTPESTRLGSQALLKAFDDSGLWLASLVQPGHLVAELRQGCGLLTRVIVTQWTRQGETHKLVKLADALLDAQPPVMTHEAGQILALLASLLGILRPVQSPRWLEACRPLLKDSVDPHLLKEALQWVSVGQLLSHFPLEDRLFWNRRLREPENDWDWESPDALDALARLAPQLPADHESLSVFQSAVPRCWWELWREKRLVLEGRGGWEPGRMPRTWQSFALGLATGISVLLLAMWMTSGKQSSSEDAVTEEPSFSFHEADGKPASSTRASRLDSAKKKDAGVSLSPNMQARLAETAKIAAEFPEIERLAKLLNTATLREASPHVQGQTTMTAQGGKGHRALLRWLMLDPPRNREVTALVSKAAVRVLGSKEMFDTLQLCLYPGSPNLDEARECASLLLALGEGLNTSQIQILTAEANASMPK